VAGSAKVLEVVTTVKVLARLVELVRWGEPWDIEEDNSVNGRTRAARAAGLTPILAHTAVRDPFLPPSNR
jgi:hypothetical protein